MNKHTFLIPLVFVFCLSACVPVALVAAGATVGGAIVYDKRGVKNIAQDRNTGSQALKKISDDPQLQSQTHITIATFNNIMLLAGQAKTDELRTRVYQIASDIPNLKLIYNEISIETPTTQSVQTHDAWITTKVKSAMLAEKGLNSTQIKVITENSVVYLMGIVTHKQADLAASVASTVSSVAKVIRIFEYE